MADDTLRCGISAFRTDECGCYYLFPHEHDAIKIKCCVKDVTSHLKSVGVATGGSYRHFSLGESMTEGQLILYRVGLYDDRLYRDVTVCPFHRYKLGIYFKQTKTCSHRSHSGNGKAYRGITVHESRDVLQSFGVLLPVGTDTQPSTADTDFLTFSQDDDDCSAKTETQPSTAETASMTFSQDLPQTSSWSTDEKKRDIILNDVNTALSLLSNGKMSPLKYQVRTDIASLHPSSKRSQVPKQIKQNRQRLPQWKVAHALDFFCNPLFHQVSSYGTKEMKLNTGEKILIPEVVRTVCHANLVHMYQAFCKEADVDPLSRSSFFEILRVCPASKRTSLRGLDNIATDGSTTFDTLDEVKKQLKLYLTDPEVQNDLEKTEQDLHSFKLYIKTDFKLHTSLADQCPFHCIMFALSEPKDQTLQNKCTHSHNMVCDRYDESNLKHRTYTHIFDQVKQDWFAVVSVLEHTLNTVKKQLSVLQQLTTEVIMQVVIIVEIPGYPLMEFQKELDIFVLGITIKRYDFSEAQDGKSYCDAKIAHLRCKIRQYVSSGNNVKTAGDMKNAIDSLGGVMGCQSAHVQINSQVAGKANKIKNTWKGISKISNIELREKQIIAFKAFGVGCGNVMSEEQLKRSVLPHCLQQKSLSWLTLLYQKSRKHYLQSPGFEHATVSRDTKLTPGTPSSDMGWAIKKERKNQRFTENLKTYLRAIFNAGEQSGRKSNADDVSRNMRVCRDENGNKMFQPDECLQPSQIASFFSRLCVMTRNTRPQQTLDDEDLEPALNLIDAMEAMDVLNS
ncbi:unnamed protein product [Mytilus edulis]|uniref:Uncharacterized protein n=1 Tax=Mytilus edulis TaxID=6550 RepID=A0A8S3RQ41_MYTED|nr:unnamed protein product [Mytilus edulis]